VELTMFLTIAYPTWPEKWVCRKKPPGKNPPFGKVGINPPFGKGEGRDDPMHTTLTG
jgi:hypothetical protein